MRALATLFALAVVASAGAAHAQSSSHRFGLGIEAGDPGGVTGKHWNNNDEALQFGVGLRAARYYGYWHYYEAYSPLFAVDWVYHFGAFGPRGRRVWFRIGIGAGAAVGWLQGGSSCYSDVFGRTYCSREEALPIVMGRIPVSFNVYLARARFEFFAQIAPGYLVLPELRPDVLGSLGARFYF